MAEIARRSWLKAIVAVAFAPFAAIASAKSDRPTRVVTVPIDGMETFRYYRVRYVLVNTRTGERHEVKPEVERW